MYQYNTDKCVICHKDFSQANKVKVSPKDITTILEFSNGFGDLELAAFLSTRPAVIFVHGDCRKRFTNKRRLTNLLQGQVHPLMKMMSKVKNFARHPVVSILRNIVSSVANWLTSEKTDLIPIMMQPRKLY